MWLPMSLPMKLGAEPTATLARHKVLPTLGKNGGDYPQLTVRTRSASAPLSQAQRGTDRALVCSTERGSPWHRPVAGNTVECGIPFSDLARLWGAVEAPEPESVDARVYGARTRARSGDYARRHAHAVRPVEQRRSPHTLEQASYFGAGLMLWTRRVPC